MNTRLLGLSTLAICLAALPSCPKTKKELAGGKADRVVSIEAGGTHGCEVDFPVAVVYIKKHYPRWKSDDNEYWIHFVGGSPFSVDPIHVPAGDKSDRIDITGDENYYKYEIWDQSKKVCKNADDDRDPGLNVKR